MYVTVIYMTLRAFVDPVVPIGNLCAGNLLENTLILRTYYASLAAPVGYFCTGSLLEKTLILRTYCAMSAAPVGDFCTEGPAAPLGDFCTGSFGEDFDFAHLLCYSGCTRRRLLHGGSGCTLRRLLHGVFWRRLRFCALIVLFRLHP
jgi:hypothetical protein